MFYNFFSTIPLWMIVSASFLLVNAIKSLRARYVFVPELFVLPLGMLFIKTRGFAIMPMQLIVLYFVCLILSGMFSFNLVLRARAQFFKEKLIVHLPGTAQPIIFLVLIFLLKFYLGYLQATNLVLAQQLISFEIGASGLLTGMVFGRALGFVYKMFLK